MNPRRGAAVSTAALVAALVVSAPAGAQGVADEVARVARDADALRTELDRVRGQYLQPEEAVRQYSLATAYVEGRYLFGIGSYDAAVDLLLPFAESAADVGSPGYDDVVFLLAETLFAQGNYLMARPYYERLAESPRVGLDAARRRLEIALAMGRYEALEGLYRDLERRAGMSVDDQVAYVRGRALYFQGRYADSIDAFDTIPVGSPLFLRARYLVGVCFSRMGRLDRAHQEFGNILAGVGAFAPDEDPGTTDLRDLTRLAQGRLFYESQDWTAAIDEYNAVERTSRHYPAALYEISWAEIRQGSEIDDPRLRDEYLGTAIYNLEVLEIIAPPNSRHQAQAELLRADLLMRMERYDDAVAEFEAAAERYLPVEVELREMRNEHDDADSFYEALVNPETGSLRLPLAARPWFDSNAEVDRAMRALADVSSLRAGIEETRQMVSELDAVLNRGGLITAFPRLREGWGRTNELQLAATRLLIELVDAEARVLDPHLDDAARSEHRALQERRLALQEAILEQPRSFAEIDEREQAVIDAINQQILEVHRTELRIREARDDLDALRELYIDRSAGAPSSDLRALRAEIDRENRRLDQLDAAARVLREDLNLRQVAVGMGDDVAEAERAARRQFIDALRSEERSLRSRRSSAPDASIVFEAIDDGIGAVMSIDRDCEAFYGGARELVAGQTAEIRDLLERERANVERYEQEIVIVAAAADATAGVVTLEAFDEVYRRFSELTLRANLGIIDVAWQRKEELTNAIEALFEERNQSIRELDADFSELLEGE